MYAVVCAALRKLTVRCGGLLQSFLPFFLHGSRDPRVTCVCPSVSISASTLLSMSLCHTAPVFSLRDEPVRSQL